MNYMSKKLRNILFSITIVMSSIFIIFLISFSSKKSKTIFDRIDTHTLSQIDVDNILSVSIDRGITDEILTEKGYIVSDKQTFSEMDHAKWYDCMKISGDSPLPIKDFSIQLSEKNNELVGFNFCYEPIDIKDENLAKIISVYIDLAGIDKFTARSGEQFTYGEISTFTNSDFEHCGSKFEIINATAKESVALFLEIDDSGKASFYGAVSENTEDDSLC